MKLNILNKRKKERKKEIKYIFNKYKRWIKLENKKEIYNLFVRTSKNLITIENFFLKKIQKNPIIYESRQQLNNYYIFFKFT
jgi:hypothetical protein